MWKIVSTAVKEFSLALQDSPECANTPAHTTQRCDSKNIPDTASQLAISPGALSEGVCSEVIEASPSSRQPPLFSLSEPHESQNKQDSDVKIYEETISQFASTQEELNCDRSSGGLETAALAQQPFGPQSGSGQGSTIGGNQLLQEELNWTIRKLQSEIATVKAKVELLQKSNKFVSASEIRSGHSEQLREENAALSARLKTSTAGSKESQLMTDLKAENQLLRISLKKMVDQKVSTMEDR
eukprot:Gregarina_sp_Poly_1__4315@NODE_2341_length_2258_cov_372_546326_g1484_i1_p2_GENE_NODE_2341_length_2258_cov_372_546326_g1484_i1NODE_2341_length_2258_cov_372_546326_g1484_i1_p2_ORF_typecomplete_len241_score47_62HOOK/PF05622_12/0_023Syntaxin6_N/PF09177_11/3_2e03Syntaxin6_N/PF09177_11/0_049Kbox/PF01486_17/0_78Kbox/PF01486_17/14DUF1192/PF06698_11/0_2DUF1192/PF06698_11/1_1e04ZapB/PF06005_12/13SlyX/PF04102_12/7_3e03SlyX/PF04102_12/2_4SlyX/PF04102_12/3_2e02SlyX/PF04102_12/5_1e03PRKG1_interact/PF15898_5/4